MNQREQRFLVDKMLGRLAKWLRVFGYDTEYSPDKFGSGLLLESLRENRMLLTRGKKLSDKRGWQVVYLKSDFIGEQLKQLASELHLKYSFDKIFSRCTLCNGKILLVSEKTQLKELVPEYVYKTQNQFYRCEKCSQIYWKGTHFDLIKNDLAKLGFEIR
ncbi:MAG: Mut7-C RNAse domain-containing protein [Elusimicrobia bacterium]|nr:Mut7-C RNAse domain-containing protein [Elusimicrobiota bacterium]